MKITFVREKMLKAVGLALKMVSNQVTLPILSNILIATDKGQLKISATDLEVGIEAWVGAKIEREGSVTVPAKLLFELLGSITDEKITINEKDNKITVTGTNSKSVIKGMSANDFPAVPHIKNPLATLEIDGQVIKKMIIRNSFSCATDETRPVLTGISFKANKEKLVFASTDSYRLSESLMPHKQKISTNIDAIVPKRTMNELSRIIDEHTENLKIEIGENQIAFTIGDIYLISRLIEGSFPEYTQIIPKKFETTAQINKAEFVKILKTASLFSRDSANNIRIELDKDGKMLSINSYSQQLGENQSKMDCDKIEGKNVKISINSSFIMDVLGVLSSETIILQTVDAQSPVMIKGVSDENYLAIVMPLRQDE